MRGALEQFERIAAFLEVELGRLDCRHVRLIEVTEEREATFERGPDVLRCDAEGARRTLFVLRNRAGDDITWLAIRGISRGGRTEREGDPA